MNLQKRGKFINLIQLYLQYKNKQKTKNMKTRFRVNRNDTVKIQLVDKEGKLLTSLYDSGFTTIR